MAKAFLEARLLSSALPHCPLEHSAETLHRAGSDYSKCQNTLSTEPATRKDKVMIQKHLWEGRGLGGWVQITKTLIAGNVQLILKDLWAKCTVSDQNQRYPLAGLRKEYAAPNTCPRILLWWYSFPAFIKCLLHVRGCAKPSMCIFLLNPHGSIVRWKLPFSRYHI